MPEGEPVGLNETVAFALEGMSPSGQARVYQLSAGAPTTTCGAILRVAIAAGKDILRLEKRSVDRISYAPKDVNIDFTLSGAQQVRRCRRRRLSALRRTASRPGRVRGS